MLYEYWLGIHQLVLVFLFSSLTYQGCLFYDRFVTSSSPQSAIHRCNLQDFLEGLLKKWFLVDHNRYQLVLVFLLSSPTYQGCLFCDRFITSSSPQSAIHRCNLQDFLEGLLKKWFLVDMHVEPQWVNKHLFPSLIKDKRGETPMTPRLVALVKRVASTRLGLRPATTPKNSPFGKFAPLAIGRSWLLNDRG
jgi:hypothetical protein